ncbi:FAD binding domain-containing protein [Truncatella angustata]|uniref:FAD binding domain-containing protein n=1 Tax=Truncatella angustata TaxID=152316 RepID=A0A9P8ZVB7_9PEZI|nr:FAD binding domain-containing protein [Truncatella angustata]KAH6652454.1 FAD binding domain-containing protein [Truncatella angustata]
MVDTGCPKPEAYLKLLLKEELQKRLSTSSNISLQGEEGFSIVDARYTDYKRPQYIAAVQVAEEQDVVEVVNYARSRGIKFAARAGGHSLTSSLRRIKNAIVIDMRGLNSIKYDEVKQQMTVGGGITTGEFANATYSHGMEVTVGSCPCTGVLGISLGAGIGRLQGKYGYLNDNMVTARLLLANGTIIEASHETNQDIFWALRGAGHNFGIVLEATYQVYPQLNDGKHFSVDFEFTLDKVEDVFETINAISDPMPREVAVFVIGRRRGANGEPTININLVYSGPEKEAVPFVKLFDAISPIWKDTKIATWDALPWATYNGLNNVLCTPEGWARFPIKNFYAANVKSYDIATMRAYFEAWRDMNQKYNGEAVFSVMFESFPQQRVRELPEDSTAYPWRHGAQHFLMIEAAYKSTVEEEVIDEWLSTQQDKFIETSGYGRLQQYVNYGHGSKDPPEALYGYEPWRLEKLRGLKQELDPEGLFNGYQPFIEEDKLDSI